jgi:localization factor PodJL
VVEAMEPRFAALESQLEAISDKVANPPELNVGQLESQVRQLVARMDQTGEQLTGLAKLYGQTPDQPDLDSLADKVAERTRAAFADRVAPQTALGEPEYAEFEKRLGKVIERAAADRPADDNSALGATIREVNERLARLELAVARPASLPLAPAPGFRLQDEPSSLTFSARTVAEAEDETAPAPKAAAPQSPPPKTVVFEVEPPPVAAAPVPELEVEAEAHTDPLAPLLAQIERDDPYVLGRLDTTEPEAAGPAPVVARSDTMPSNPVEEAPLYDRPFDDPSPVQRALEAKNGPRRRHPGMAVAPVDDDLPPAPTPSMDFGSAEPASFSVADERPPAPPSSFDSIDVEPEPEQAPDHTATNRNTFIAAARRAAMRQSGSAAAAPIATSGNSLIARAFARFQASKAADAETKGDAKAMPVPPPVVAEPAPADTPVSGKPARPAREPKPKKVKAEKPKAEKPARERRFSIGRRELAGDKEPSVAWTPDETVPVLPAAPEPQAIALGAEATSPAPDGEAPAKPGLITRYRTLILAAITVLLIVAMANLMIMRSQDGGSESAPVDVGDAALSPTPMALQLDLPTAPVASARVIPMTDTLSTASIDPGAASGFSPVVTDQTMPPAVDAAAEVAAIDTSDLSTTVQPLDQLASPVQVDMPPENTGPIELRQAAANGDARAQFEIAAIYTEGRAVPEDLEAAAVWYERAASQGFAPAQYRLGNLYEAGKGVEKDLTQARIWYQQAAEAGNRMAMHNLAALYAGGGLGKQQFDSAAKWFEEAATRGMKDSQFNLGMLYARGLGVKQDFAASYKWFGLAASRGDADAAKARDDIGKSLDAATVQRLNQELAGWQPAQIALAANFAPIGTWTTNFDPGTAISKVEVVKGVQQALSRLGYDVGTPDGLAGPKTAEAIKAFEKGTGMRETGTVNPRLLAVLGSQPV